jgi:hypothetical protein
MALEKKYIIQIRTIISTKGFSEEEKEQMVSNATGQRTTSIREMYTREAIALIKALNGTPEAPQESTKKRRMKRQILALCHEMDWETDDDKVDMKRVNAYCVQRGYLKKPFDDYTEKELPTLVAQFKQMHKNYLQNAKRPV